MKKRLMTSMLFLLSVLLVGCSGGVGSILIEVDPPGTEVYLGNQFIGTAPLFIPEVQSGKVNLTLRKSGYETKRLSVSVQTGQQTMVSEELSLTREHLIATAKQQAEPTAPVKLFLLRGAKLIDIPYSTYWSELTMLGFGQLFVEAAETRMRPQDDTDGLVKVLGTQSSWRIHQPGPDIAVVNLKGTDLAFVVGLDNNKWHLINFESDFEYLASLSYEELTTKTLQWLTDITGTSILVELFGDEDDKANLAQIVGNEAIERKPRWITIKRWSGKGNRQTETFEISNDEWQIEWSATNEEFFGFLVVHLYKENGRFVSIPVNQTGEGNGSTYVRGAGRYYLDIQGANIDWEIRVLDYK